jgi:hypothetical protein
LSEAGLVGAGPRQGRKPVAELFEDTFGLYRRNFRLIVGIFAIFQIPVAIATVPLYAWNAGLARGPWTGVPPRLPTVDQVASTSLAASAIALLAFLLGTFGMASVAYVAGRSGSAGAPRVRDILIALREATPRLLGYVLILVAGLLAVVVGVVAVPLTILAISGNAGLTIGVAVVMGLGATGVLIFALVRWSVAIPALILEGLGPFGSLRRSWHLVAGRTWRTLGIMFIAGLVIGLVGGLVSPMYVPGVAEGVLSGSLSSYMLIAVVTALVQVVVGPVFPTLLTVLYLDYAGARGNAA